ncbi:type II toxin-antitoxin system CcdA family antitoxin [Ruegeria sp. MALMAid1280]|uniref:type II toxin-antitoxin system CcdA family antitoxin n=1 Tax=Ruegeria sp. MALMAid1280 TaxID=3411634 RepID=UPI001479BC03
MPRNAQEKQRTNVTLTSGNLEKARQLGLNVSAISDAALADAVAKAEAELWAKENAKAIAERQKWIEENGTPLADIQALRTN